MTQATPLLRVVVLVSGRGSNLKAIAAQARAGALPIPTSSGTSTAPVAAG